MRAFPAPGITSATTATATKSAPSKTALLLLQGFFDAFYSVAVKDACPTFTPIYCKIFV
jgi:hypothetical protein